MTKKAKRAKKRRYSKSSGSDVESEMHRYKKGTAKSGRGGKGGKVKSRKQAIAIGLSKARKKGRKSQRRSRAPDTFEAIVFRAMQRAVMDGSAFALSGNRFC